MTKGDDRSKRNVWEVLFFLENNICDWQTRYKLPSLPHAYEVP